MATEPMLPIKVLVTPGLSVTSITISGKKAPLGGFVAVRPSTATLTLPTGTASKAKLPLLSVKATRSGRPTMKTLAPAIGRRKTSSAVWIKPSGPRPMSSKVIGSRSGPGSTTLPSSLAPVTDVVLTVAKLQARSPPATPLLSASRKLPSCAARIAPPFRCNVTCAPPGIGWSKKSQAKLPSSAGTIVVASLLPSGAVAKKLFAFSVAGLTAREKKTWGLKVEPTSTAPLPGVTRATVKGESASMLTPRVSVVVLPAASRAVVRSVCAPTVRSPSGSAWLKAPVSAL